MLCREHGQQLLAELLLAANNEKGAGADWQTQVALWGTVKEIGVDDEGLLEFYNDYYTVPLYRDVDRALYAAFGSRKIALTTWNPVQLWRGYRELGRRVAEKKISGNLKGEGLIQGGILIFDATGTLRYAYEEEIGTPLDLDDIRAAVRAVLNEPKEEL